MELSPEAKAVVTRVANDNEISEHAPKSATLLLKNSEKTIGLSLIKDDTKFRKSLVDEVKALETGKF